MSTEQNKPNDITKTDTGSNEPQWILDFENSDIEAPSDHLKKKTEILESQVNDVQLPKLSDVKNPTPNVAANPLPKIDEPKTPEVNKIKQQAESKTAHVKNLPPNVASQPLPKIDEPKTVETNKIKQQAESKTAHVKNIPPKVAAKPLPKIDEPKIVEVNKIKQQAESKPAHIKNPDPKVVAKPIQNTASTQNPDDCDNKKIIITDKATKPKNKSKWLSTLLSLLLFIFLVILPWVCVIGYVTTIAHPRYVTKSDVVVKQVGDANVSTTIGISALLGVNSTSIEDARYLTQFVLSHDMIKRLDKTLDFRQEYYIDGSDFIYELPENATQEELLEYFKKRVDVSLNEQTNILTVKTEGFKPEYALKLNQAILNESDSFVNNLSQKVAKEQLQYSHNQLLLSQDRLNEAKQQLLNYQNQTAIIDPKINVQLVSQLIGNLQAQLASLRTEERQLLSYLNPDAPQIVSIRSQVSSVKAQINEEQAKLTSRDSAKLNAQTIQFEAIKSNVDFATEMYKISLSSYEKSRLEAYRKRKNLITIASPHKAEEALYPRKHYIIWTSLAFLLILYGFIRLVMAVIKDHAS